MRNLFLLSLFLFAFIINSCNNNPSTPEQNHPPVIKSITANPSQIDIVATTILTVSAVDEDGDVLTYTWSANNGTFPKGNTAKSVTWKAPGSVGDYICKVTVSDNKSVVEKEVSISVIENPVLKVSPTSLIFGESELTKTFNIINNGTGKLTWNLSTNQNWINFNPNSGNTTTDTTQITVNVDRSGLNPGTYNGTVNINSNSGNATLGITMIVLQTVNVNGHCYYSSTTIPMSGVSISIDDVSFTTDDNGYFELNVTTGTKTITATKSAYDTYSQTIQVPTNGLSLNIEMTSSSHTSLLSGVVRYSFDSSPLSDVIISVLNPDGSTSSLFDQSDINGYYQIPTVPQGNRTIRYEHDEFDTYETNIFISSDNRNFDVTLNPKTSIEIINDITSNTTFKEMHSPYIIKNHIKILEAVSLTIEPGTIVKVESGAIEVFGTLNAVGTSLKMITFTSASGSQNIGDWKGVWFTNSSNDYNCILEYCNLEYMKNLKIEYSNPIINNCIITKSTYISVKNSSTTFTSCTFTQIQFMAAGTFNLVNCKIMNITNDNSSGFMSTTGEIINCEFSNNLGGGTLCSASKIANCVFMNNECYSQLILGTYISNNLIKANKAPYITHQYKNEGEFINNIVFNNDVDNIIYERSRFKMRIYR